MEKEIELFNPELKNLFLDAAENPHSKLNRLSAVKRFTEREKELQKDLYAFDDEEISKFIMNGDLGMKHQSIEVNLSFIKSYKDFCMTQDYVRDNVAQLSPGLVYVRPVNAYRSGLVANSADLQKCLDDIFQLTDPGNPALSDIVRGYVWLAFSGMDDNSAILLQKHNVIFEEQKIAFNGREYKIYPESIHALRICCNATHLTMMKNRTYGSVPRVKSNLILRTSNDVAIDRMSRSLAGLLVRRMGMCDDEGVPHRQLSYLRVWNSGIFSRAYDIELAGGDAAEYLGKFAAEVIAERDARKKYMTPGRFKLSTKIADLKSALSEDYITWKQAFINK